MSRRYKRVAWIGRIAEMESTCRLIVIAHEAQEKFITRRNDATRKDISAEDAVDCGARVVAVVDDESITIAIAGILHAEIVEAEVNSLVFVRRYDEVG